MTAQLFGGLQGPDEKQSSADLLSDVGPQKRNLGLHGSSSQQQPTSAVAKLLAGILHGLRLPTAAFAISITVVTSFFMTIFGFRAALRYPQWCWPLLGCVLLAPAGLELADFILTQVRLISSCCMKDEMRYLILCVRNHNRCVLTMHGGAGCEVD